MLLLSFNPNYFENPHPLSGTSPLQEEEINKKINFRK
jgi:hypothetical protein